jgi:hypothetical protein
MNHAISILSIFLGVVGIAYAVPNAINYQGRLTDGDGNPASGSKLFSLSLYDAATAGNELYTETIGSIAVDENGIYNFQFGANGTSTVAADEVIATTDGSSQVFNATLSELPVDGSVSIADGIYTWSQAGGSSAPSEFTGSVTVATGAISAIYLSGAPSSGTDITASYDYSESGVSGALRTGSAHWIELSVDGDTQSPRERVLSVPFAQVAGSAKLMIKKQSSVCMNGPFGSAYIPISSSQTNTTESSGYAYPYHDYKVTNYSRYLEGIPFAQLNRIRLFVSELSGTGQYYAKFTATLVETNLSSGVSTNTVFESEVDSNSAIVIPVVPSGSFDFSDNQYLLYLRFYHIQSSIGNQEADRITVEKVLFDYETL